MIEFTKMHGLGNDYIYIDRTNPNNYIPEDKLPQFTKYVSDRNFGIGGDGAIFIENSDVADYKMRILNRDGSEAEMCGNGIRCFSKLVYEKKLTDKKELKIETLAGIKEATLHVTPYGVQEVTVKMGEPTYYEHVLNIEGKEINCMCVSMGNPHCIILWNDLNNLEIEKYGPMIERHKDFPNRTNVEFIKVLDKNHIQMRVWERGSDETFACGTGACATAVASYLQGFTRRNVTLHLKGGDLKINWNEQDNNVYMRGPATKVFEGTIDY